MKKDICRVCGAPPNEPHGESQNPETYEMESVCDDNDRISIPDDFHSDSYEDDDNRFAGLNSHGNDLFGRSGW